VQPRFRRQPAASRSIGSRAHPAGSTGAADVGIRLTRAGQERNAADPAGKLDALRSRMSWCFSATPYTAPEELFDKTGVAQSSRLVGRIWIFAYYGPPRFRDKRRRTAEDNRRAAAPPLPRATGPRLGNAAPGSSQRATQRSPGGVTACGFPQPANFATTAANSSFLSASSCPVLHVTHLGASRIDATAGLRLSRAPHHAVSQVLP